MADATGNKAAPDLRFRRSGAALVGSPGWTRTNNPPVNSRMLCQLSYRGSSAPSSAATANISKRLGGVRNQPSPRSSRMRSNAWLAAATTAESAGSMPSSYS